MDGGGDFERSGGGGVTWRERAAAVALLSAEVAAILGLVDWRCGGGGGGGGGGMVDDARLESWFGPDDAGSPGKDDGGIPEDEVRLPIEDVGLLEGPV